MYKEKIKKKVYEMFETDNFDFLDSIKIDTNITKKLFHYQELHLYNLVSSIKHNRVILDGSDTGTGKTYTAIALCKHFNLRPIIIAPLIILSFWANICKFFDIEPILIINYECIKKKNTKTQYYETFYNNKKFGINWTIPDDAMIIFDEVHKCKNKGTINHDLLMSINNIKNKILLISGTIADSSKTFCVFGYVLGLYKTLNRGHNWIKNKLMEDRAAVGIKESAIHREIFGVKGSRMCIKDIKDEFPENQVYAECYTIEKEQIDQVNKLFDMVSINSGKIVMKKDEGNVASNITDHFLGQLVHMRMQLEKIKLNIIIELTNNYIENGYNVAIFVNFDESLNELCLQLNTNCVIRGGQTPEEKDKNILDFQNNTTNVIICNIKSGSECISLHDINGRPRVSIISPSFSSAELKQALGRIYRVGSLSPALQRIIYCANTCEEIICNKLNDKLKFAGLIYDQDLCINYTKI